MKALGALIKSYLPTSQAVNAVSKAVILEIETKHSANLFHDLSFQDSELYPFFISLPVNQNLRLFSLFSDSCAEVFIYAGHRDVAVPMNLRNAKNIIKLAIVYK